MTDLDELKQHIEKAKECLDYMLEDARNAGFRIIPICPYVRGQYARHPEWAPLFTTAPGEDP